MDKPEHLRTFHSGQEVVLVAEDDVMIQNITRLTLETAGYGILTAHDGVEALHLSRQYNGTIHLLLTDILMPRMTGLELCEHIRIERPETQLLVMSGTHYPGKDVRYLAKPFTPSALRSAVAD